MTVVLIPLKLIPISPCIETTKHPAAPQLFHGCGSVSSTGIVGTAPLQSVRWPEDSMFILTQRRSHEKSKR
jgi:hypothetical protein